jgi:two-component system response regulator
MILLIEDSRDDEDLMRLALAEIGVDTAVVAVRDGGDAITLIDAMNRPDTRLPQLVLVDVNLPKVNGFEVVRHLRAGRRTCCVPAVMLTTSCQESDLRAAYAAGANSYIQKPVDFVAFVDVVRTLSIYWITLNRTVAPADA